MTSVADEANALRRVAEAGPIGKRHSNFELYELLAGCMHLAERCAERSAMDEMRTLALESSTNRGSRTYIERDSDVFILVCRYVFSNLRSASAERSNASRYAATLRQARKIGVTSKTLSEHLRDRGGINALFLRRPLAATTVETKCLRLTKAIVFPKDATMRISLHRLPDNTYDVIATEEVHQLEVAE
jgi:hypothetical protein